MLTSMAKTLGIAGQFCPEDNPSSQFAFNVRAAGTIGGSVIR